MQKILVIALAVLFVCTHAVADIDDLLPLDELEKFDVELSDETLEVLNWASDLRSKVVANVDSFGAVGDGVSDDTQAFLSAWKKACSTPKSVFLVPEGRRYLVRRTKFTGPCASKLIIQIDGTIVAPDEPDEWDTEIPIIWLKFFEIKGVSFQGGGVIDGSGRKWWESSCKRNKTNPCRGAPTALTIESSSDVNVRNLTIQNSQQVHFNVSFSSSVHIYGVKVVAPESSPNTDGIHISNSDHVVIQNCNVGTGDDCISIVNSSSHIKIKNVYCGPGTHGISIGSLGKDNGTGIVSKVVVDNVIFNRSTNGLRIKTWQGGSGYVRHVRFDNVRVEEIANPIIIDQFYCDSSKSCQNKTSAVKISNILYRNISGTTESKAAMKFACSDTVPCKNIYVTDINLESTNGTAETYCNSVSGLARGYVHPSADCLSNFDAKDVNVTKPI